MLPGEACAEHDPAQAEERVRDDAVDSVAIDPIRQIRSNQKRPDERGEQRSPEPREVLSVSGRHGTDYWSYLRSVDRLLGEFDARVHWGKLHFLTRDQLLRRYPMAERFIEIRRELDPAGVFLNDHLRPVFA